MNKQGPNVISRRRLLRFAAAGSAIGLVSACAPPPARPPDPAASATSAGVEPAPTSGASTVEQGTLNVLVCCYAPPDLDVRNKVNADFEAKNSGIKLEQQLLPGGQNYFEKLQTLLAANQMPDVFDMWEGYVQPYAASGALLSLEPFLQADTVVKKSDIVPSALDASSWQGQVYAWIIGFIPGPVSLYYNEDHFASASLTPPTSDWTWDDLRTAAQKLTQDTSGDGTPDRWGLIFDNWFVMWLYWLWSNGADVFNADESQTTITDPKVAEAIGYWADMVVKDKIAANSGVIQSLNGSVNAFRTGSASMYLGNSWDVGTLKEAKDLKWKAVLSPKSNAGTRSWYMHLQCWAISSQTKMPNAAWTYIRDFTLEYEPSVQAVSPTIPALKQLLPAFKNETTEQLGYGPLLGMAEQPGFTRIPGAGAKWDKIAGLIQAELDLAFLGKKDVGEALQTAKVQVDEELARKA